VGKRNDSTNSYLLTPNSYGCLYVVGTPIGNLEDITLRAIRILKEAHCILCEDKRITQKLLNHYQIKTKLITFQKFNERSIENQILQLLAEGKNLALVSDAGMPLVSDPGESLIALLRKKEVKVVSVPGVSSLTSALSLFGMPEGEILFFGFLPSEKGKRKKILLSLESRSRNVIFFISPHDLKKYLGEIKELYPDVNVYLAKELTKIHEECFLGQVSDVEMFLNSKFSSRVKGEYVVGLNFEVNDGPVLIDNKKINNELNNFISEGFSLKEASKIVGNKYNLSKNQLYDGYVKNKKRG